MIMMKCMCSLVIAWETRCQLAMLQKELHPLVVYGIPVDTHVDMQ